MNKPTLKEQAHGEIEKIFRILLPQNGLSVREEQITLCHAMLDTLLKNNNEVNYLLQFHLLEKAIHELGFEIINRRSWIKIPLKGILDVVREIEKLRSV